MELLKYVSMMWRLRCCEMHEETKSQINGLQDVDKIITIIHESRTYKPQREKYAKQSNILTFVISLSKRTDTGGLELGKVTMQASTAPSSKRSLLPEYDPGPPETDVLPKVDTADWTKPERTHRTTPIGPTKTQIAFRAYFVSSNKTET